MFTAASRCTRCAPAFQNRYKNEQFVLLFVYCSFILCCVLLLLEDKRFELVTILPGLVIGPNALQNAISTNIVSELQRIILLD